MPHQTPNNLPGDPVFTQAQIDAIAAASGETSAQVAECIDQANTSAKAVHTRILIYKYWQTF